MISIKYDFPSPTKARSAQHRLPRGALSTSFRTGFLLPLLSLSLTSLPHPPPPVRLPLSPRGNPGFNPFPYNFLPMHREKLARNTHAHARTPGAPLPQPPPPPFSCSSFVRPLVGGHRLLDFIEFSSSARRHPVQTRIRQLTPLACGGSAIKPSRERNPIHPKASRRGSRRLAFSAQRESRMLRRQNFAVNLLRSIQVICYSIMFYPFSFRFAVPIRYLFALLKILQIFTFKMT